MNYRNYLILFFILLHVFVLGQIKTFNNGRKVGLKINNQKLLKAKFDSITICESNIYLAYRKNNFFYFNSKLDKIFKGNDIKKCYPFKNDFAVAFDNKTGFWKAFNNNGETIFTNYYNNDVPTIKKNAVVFENNKTLYLIKNKLSVEYDSLCFFGDNLVYCETSKLLKGEKRVLGFRVKKATYDFDRFILNTLTAVKISDVSYIKEIREGLYHAYLRGVGMIMDSEGKILINNVQKYYSINNDNIVAKKDSHFVLLNISSKTILLNSSNISKFDSISKNYWFTSKDSTFIFDGSKVTHSFRGKKVSPNEYGMFICKADNKEFITTANGQKISDAYDKVLSIFDEKTAVVENKKQFAYINIKENTLKTNYFDIYYAKRYSGGGNSRGRKFLGAMVAILATPLLPIVMAKHKPNSGSSGGYYIICNKPNPFIGSYAIIGTGIKKDIIKHGDSLTLLSDKLLHFFFIDENGKQVSKLYLDAWPFYNEWTWVKNINGKYQRIDKQFNPIEKINYSKVEPVWDGEYFMVEKDLFKVGLMNKNGDWVAKPIYDWLIIGETHIKAVQRTNEKIIIEK
ncbi:MAG: hypothetical protein SFY56_06350 [Bacteroidota bacterium]|nr:hypothetical protein [Bacteroidota bacterium]